jgi:hypothetical protein
MRTVLAVVSSVALASCGGPSEPVVCDGHQDVEFGTGNKVFIHLDDGDPIAIFNGPQGGSHMYAAVEACHIEGPLRVEFNILDETLGQYIAQAEYVRPLTPTRTCCGTVVDMRGFVSIPSPTTDADTGYTYSYGGIAADLDGHDLTIVIKVTDDDDQVFEMTRRYVGWNAGTE